jgi:hypothetical protein
MPSDVLLKNPQMIMKGNRLFLGQLLQEILETIE